MMTPADAWSIIKLTLIHCTVALVVSGAFALTIHVCAQFYPATSFVVLWLNKIDLMLAIIAPTGLALLFINSFVRIVADGLISTWKGFPHVNAHIVLA